MACRTSHAAALCEIGARTLKGWRSAAGKTAPGNSLLARLDRRLAKADAEFIRVHLAKVAEAKPGAWQSSAWLLERKFQNDFALVQRLETGSPGDFAKLSGGRGRQAKILAACREAAEDGRGEGRRCLTGSRRLTRPRSSGCRLGDQRELLTLLDRADALNARDDLIAYTKRVTPGYIASWVHREMAANLEAVERGEIRRLNAHSAPARREVALGFAAFRVVVSWAGTRTKEVIATSIRRRACRRLRADRVRNVIESPEHREVFPESGVASDSRAADRWETTKGGVYIAGGNHRPDCRAEVRGPCS